MKCFDVFPENWDALMVLLACDRQLLWGPSGPIGLDLAAAMPVMNLLVREEDRERTFWKLKILERVIIDERPQGS